jgi:hypothetical protein
MNLVALFCYTFFPFLAFVHKVVFALTADIHINFRKQWDDDTNKMCFVLLMVQ